MVWRESYNRLPLQTPFQDNENFCVSYDSHNNIHYFIKPESQDWSVENWKTCPDDNSITRGHFNIIQLLNSINPSDQQRLIFLHDLSVKQRHFMYQTLHEMNIQYLKKMNGLSHICDSVSIFFLHALLTIPQYDYFTSSFRRIYIKDKEAFDDFYQNLDPIQSYDNYISYFSLFISNMRKINNKKDNTDIKLEICNLLYDIQENVTDAQYKELIEMVAKIR
jgi:hypothetical protein